MKRYCSVLPRYSAAAVLLVLAALSQGSVYGLSHRGGRQPSSQQEASGPAISMVQGGLRSVQKHSSSAREECFWPGQSTTSYNTLRLQMQLDAGSVLEAVKLCQKHCRETWNCSLITYNKKTKTCFLKMFDWPRLVDSPDELTTGKNCSLPEGSDAFAEPSGCFRKGVGSTTANITHKSAPTVQACQDECRKLSGCTHFTYNVREKVCHLKGGSPSWRAYADDWSATRDCQLNAKADPTKNCFRKNIASTTHSIKQKTIDSGSTMDSLKACQEECRRTSNCTHFTYNVDAQVCYVKGDGPHWKEHAGDMSATSECDLSGVHVETDPKACFKKDMGSTTPEIRRKHIDAGRVLLSVRQCRDECRKMDNCSHFTYNADSKTCYLKGGSPNWRAYNGDLSASRGCSDESIAPDCISENIASRNATVRERRIDSGSFYKNLKNCHDLCVSESRCTHVTYDFRKQTCYLKESFGAIVRDENAVSIDKECDW